MISQGYVHAFSQDYYGRFPHPPAYYHNQMQPYHYPMQMNGDFPQGNVQNQQANMMQQPVEPMTIGPLQGGPQMQPSYPYMGAHQVQQGFSPFDNPLHPQVKRPPLQQFSNPYPKQQFLQKPQPSGFQSVLNQFKTQDGSVDINKMMNTAGQMMNTFSQMSSVVKGIGGFFIK